MHDDLLGLNRQGRTWTVRVGVVAALIAGTTPALPGTSSTFHDRTPAPPTVLTAAVFAPPVAGVVSAVLSSAGVGLTWPASMAGTATASYSVVRTDDLGASTDVCTGSGAPIAMAGTASCTDSSVQAGRTYRYVQQPVLVRDGRTTWTQPPSAPSAPVTIPPVVAGPRLVFSSASPAVTSTKSETVTLPYPSGTAIGDLLLLVSFGGRSSLPVAPVGWGEVASISTRGGDSSHLLVAWRVADASGSVTFDAKANSAGTVTRIVRYARAPGVLDQPVLAGAPSTGISAVDASVATVGVATTASSATVIEVVAVRDATSIALTTSSVVLRSSETLQPGRIALSVGVADGFAASIGPTSGSGWKLAGRTAEWLWASIAFR